MPRHTSTPITWGTLNLILIAFITGNSGLEPLIEGLCAQIHVNLRWRVFGRNRTGDFTDYSISWVPRSPPLNYGDGWITENPLGPFYKWPRNFCFCYVSTHTPKLFNCCYATQTSFFDTHRYDCLFGRAVASMWIGEALGVGSYCRDKISGTTFSGPGTYLISWKSQSAKNWHSRRMLWDGAFCVKRYFRLSWLE